MHWAISLGSYREYGQRGTHFARVIRLIRKAQAQEGKTVDQIQIGSECVSTGFEFGPPLLHNLCLGEVLGRLWDELLGHHRACTFWEPISWTFRAHKVLLKQT